METTYVSISGWMNKGNLVQTQWNIIQKEGTPAICNNMDGLWEYYAKWNKSDVERQISYDLTYITGLGKSRFTVVCMENNTVINK